MNEAALAGVVVDESVTAEAFLRDRRDTLVLVDTIPDEVSGGPPSQFFEDRDGFVLSCEDLGVLRFGRLPTAIIGHVAAGLSLDDFRYQATRRWLAIVFPLWGLPTLHASAAGKGGSAVLLSGSSHAGKSTMALALSRRTGWRHMADDSVVLDVRPTGVTLLPLSSEVRLRPATKEHFGFHGASEAVVRSGTKAAALCFLEPNGSASSPSLHRIGAIAALQFTMEQAFLLTLEDEDVNSVMTERIVDFLAQTPVYRLDYCQSFEGFDEVLDLVAGLLT